MAYEDAYGGVYRLEGGRSTNAGSRYGREILIGCDPHDRTKRPVVTAVKDASSSIVAASVGDGQHGNVTACRE